jgi:hypothetical protein
MQTLANMAGLGILKTNLNSDSCQPRQQFFSKSNNWLRSDLFHPDGNHESIRGFELTGIHPFKSEPLERGRAPTE